MIQINYDMDKPNTCAECPLADWEFYCCHGRREAQSWDIEKNVRQELPPPDWCPLIEITCKTCFLGSITPICPVTTCKNNKNYKKDENET